MRSIPGCCQADATNALTLDNIFKALDQVLSELMNKSAWSLSLTILHFCRALFQVVSKLMESMEYLEPAVAVVLGLVGVKMVRAFFCVCAPSVVRRACHFCVSAQPHVCM